MIKEYTYEEFSIGDVFETTFQITEQIAKNYIESIGKKYSPEQKLPASILAIYIPWYEALGGRFPQGTIHLKQRMECFGEPSVGDIYKVVIRVIEKYEKKGRYYLVHETIFQKDDQLFNKQITTQLLGFAEKNCG